MVSKAVIRMEEAQSTMKQGFKGRQIPKDVSFTVTKTVELKGWRLKGCRPKRGNATKEPRVHQISRFDPFCVLTSSSLLSCLFVLQVLFVKRDMGLSFI